VQKIEVVFYRTAAGTEVVRDWLLSLEKVERQTIGTDLKTLQYGWPIGMPLCRSLGGGIWEIRSNLPTQKIVRILFAIKDGKILILSGFVKKSQRTPKSEIDTALRRLSEF
jgi:phage-related protein